MLCTVFVCLIASGGAFAYSSQGSGSQPVFAVPLPSFAAQPVWLSECPCGTPLMNGSGLGAGNLDDPVREERMALIEASRTNPRQWTLVLLMGQTRSVVFTADQIVANLLLPNEPCHLSVALDSGPSRLPAHASKTFQPWLVSEQVVRPPCARDARSCAHVEFRLALAALEGGLRHGGQRGLTYNYMLSARTDLFVAAPLCVKALLGRVDAQRLAALMRRLDAAVTAVEPTHASTLAPEETDAQRLTSRWLLGSGSTALAIARARAAAQRRSFTQWCPESVPICSHANATRALRSDIRSSQVSDLQRLTQRMAAKHRLLGVLGNTWLRFGSASVLARHLRDSVANWGRSFSSVCGVEPLPKWHPVHRDKLVDFREVTETQLRLSVWATGATLVEVPVPFSPKHGAKSLLRIQQQAAKRAAAFLVRSNQVERLCLCSSNSTVRLGDP